MIFSATNEKHNRVWLMNDKIGNTFSDIYAFYYKKSFFFAKSYVHDDLAAELSTRISTLEACNPDEIFSEEVESIVRETLDLLPEQTRRIFLLSRFENKSNKEIAEEMKISIKGVEYHISKALKVLRVSLKDYLPLFYFYFYIKF